MFRNILVPTDDSECASLAMDYATDLAEQYDATAHVLNVVDSRLVATGPHYDECRDEATDITSTAGDRLAHEGISVERAVRTGVPYKAILKCAAEEGIDLVVIGTHGRTGVDRYLLGSVTENVIRRADVPVLTIRTSDERTVTYPYEDILVPTDGSEESLAAVDPAVNVARTYGATLHSLSAIDTHSIGIDVDTGELRDQLEDSALEAVEAVEERAVEASVSKTETAVVYGLPHQRICSYVTEHDVDLVVMGTHGYSGIPRYLLGSIAEKLVRTAPVPVMTVRAPAEA